MILEFGLCVCFSHAIIRSHVGEEDIKKYNK